MSRMPKSMVLPDKTITAVRSCIATYLSRTKFMAKRILDYMYGPPKHPKRTPKRERLWEAADIMATFILWRVNDEAWDGCEEVCKSTAKLIEVELQKLGCRYPQK